MKKNTIVAGPVSRRALLHGLVVGAGFCLLPATAFAAANKSTSSAIAFYGNALIVARGSTGSGLETSGRISPGILARQARFKMRE